MSHWLQKVVDLLQAETDDLRALAELAGGDPRTFYRGTRLGENIDISGQDLRGMEFTDFDLAEVKIDGHTKLDLLSASAEHQLSTRSSENTNIKIANGNDERYSSWLRRWSNAPGTVRDAATHEGELLLETTQSVLPIWWPVVWHKIWLTEKRNSERRKRLLVLAQRNIARVETNLFYWIIVARRLWKNASVQEAMALKMFANRAVKRLSQKDGSERRWVQYWNEVAHLCRLTKVGLEDLFEIGIDWLKSQDPNHPNWGSVWRSMWRLNPESRYPESRYKELLFQMAVHWLFHADSLTPNWPAILKSVLRSSREEEEIKWKILSMAEIWLRNHTESAFWPIVWSELWRQSRDDDKQWLDFVVQHFIEKNDGPTGKKLLKEVGMHWLSESKINTEWMNVWFTLWFSDDEIQGELKRVVEKRLEKQPYDGTLAAIRDVIYRERA